MALEGLLAEDRLALGVVELETSQDKPLAHSGSPIAA